MKKLVSGLFALVLVLSVARSAFAVAWGMPSGNAPGPTNQSIASNGQINNGGATVIGSVLLSAIGTPSAPTMTTNGTAGSTTLTYACVGFDFNGNQTIPSATATITTANATLTAANSVNVTCGPKNGAVGFLINKADTAHIIGYCYSTNNASCTFVDTGTYVNGTGGSSQTSSFTYTANTVDQTVGITGGASLGGLQGSTNAVVSNSVESFFTVYGAGVGQVAATIGDATTVVNRPASIKNLNCGTYTILGAAVAAGGTSWVFALNTGAPGVAPTDSALTCTELAAATTCSDTTHVIQLAALSNIDFSITPSGSPTAAVAKCSADIVM